jgi:phage tail sheath protein FI
LNNRLAQDKQLGIILGGEALFSDKNTPTTLANQELYIDYKLTVVKPTLLITLTQVLTDEYVKELL